jgi:protein-S-isoprenylcysteine O-methyltransferase Ste14
MKTQATLLVAVQMILFALLAGALLLLPAGQVGWVRLVGVVLALIGLALIFLAILNHWQANQALVKVSPEPNAAVDLVQSGLYARIRHPIYSGVMLAGLGAALAHGHWLPLLIALGLVVFFSYKSTFEERWLMQVYPAYADYRQRAGRFLPRWLG